VIADLVVDRFLYGTPRRISREAPVVILEHEREKIVPGGGANTLTNVAALGGRPHAVGSVGNDEAGRDLLECLADAGVDIESIDTRPDWSTPSKTRILGGAPNTAKQQIVRYDIGQPMTQTDRDLESMVERAAAAFARSEGAGEGSRIVVLSDYGYGTVPPRLLERLRLALGGALFLVDSRYSLGHFSGVDGATPNQEEAEALAGAALDTPAQLEQHARTLLDRLESAFVLVTRGSQGMALIERAPSPAISLLPVAGSREVTDVTGAGDTVIGTFALALAAGASPLEATCLANYAGGVVVMKSGTATLTAAELTAAVDGDPGPLRALEYRLLAQ
jgi:rfaE bifunctional protein kinase chain/domain